MQKCFFCFAQGSLTQTSAKPTPGVWGRAPSKPTGPSCNARNSAKPTQGFGGSPPRNIAAKLKAKPKGKELWLIQLPPKLDLEKVKTLKLDGSFKIDKKSYVLEESGQTQSVTTLTPSGDELKVGQPVSKSFTLREHFEIPEIDYEKVVVPKPVVQQKDDLRMRYFPPSGAESSSSPSAKRATKNVDEENADEEPSPKKHKKEKKEKKEKKDKKDKKDKKKKSKD
ncbi:hypothetical protein TRICI_005700 [Trichomonascus ciferrii]|uniref:DNA-directed RNA polymerase I subunit RPA34 n=1 Tax=Trichomonascus ciferrii TaxID=44093 RepID=A0A642UQ48_9ASCO|nr:hypothetical protein TRICI_005700 [Trichomonascus ciferrii]